MPENNKNVGTKIAQAINVEGFWHNNKNLNENNDLHTRQKCRASDKNDERFGYGIPANIVPKFNGW